MNVRGASRYQLSRHSGWEDFIQTNLEDLSMNIVAHFDIPMLPLNGWIRMVHSILSPGTKEHARSIHGPRQSIYKQPCKQTIRLRWSRLLQKSNKWVNAFHMLLATIFDITRRNQCDIVAGHCPTRGWLWKGHVSLSNVRASGLAGRVFLP